jgi:hypothetical protein
VIQSVLLSGMHSPTLSLTLDQNMSKITVIASIVLQAVTAGDQQTRLDGGDILRE